MTEQPAPDRIPIMFRPTREQLAAINARAMATGLSRNAWLERAVAWALEQPIRTTTRTERT